MSNALRTARLRICQTDTSRLAMRHIAAFYAARAVARGGWVPQSKLAPGEKRNGNQPMSTVAEGKSCGVRSG